MNVLQVNTYYPGGSTGRIAAEIAAYTTTQPDTRMTVAFGIGNASQDDGIKAVRIGTSFERKLHGIFRKLFDAEGYGSRAATRQLIRLCQDARVDVIHLHNLHGCYINLKRWFRYLRRSSIPVVWTLHDCWSMTGHCAYFCAAGCNKWKTQCRKCPEQRSYPVCIGIDGSKRNYRLKKRLFSGLNRLTLVMPCQWLKDIAGESYLHNIDMRVIYNGVDTSRFRPVNSGLRKQFNMESKRVLLAVASDWDRRKGLDDLVAMSEMLDASYQIVIIGLIRSQIDALPGKIIGLERTATQEQLIAWYSAADCLVNPTHDDTMPLVNLEALACGTPVIVYNTGGCPEAVTDNCGAVVEKGDIKGLVNAVKNLCATGKVSSDDCVQQAMRFEMQRTVREYNELYREVLQ